MRRHIRNLLVVLIASICLTVTFFLFNWNDVLASLRRTEPGTLIGGGLAVIFTTFLVRGLRWLVVQGAPVTTATLRASCLANGAASGLAIITPFQVGEAIKIRLAPRQTAPSWKVDTSAFLVERTLDMAALCGIGACGLALHWGHAWMAPVALLAPLIASHVLWLLSNHIRLLPAKLQPYLEAFAHRKRLLRAAMLTVPLWLLNTALWWLAAKSVGIDLMFGEATLLVSGVMLAIIGSMSPSGLGVSELGSRGIMLWLGHSVQSAESTAIALRLLTPLIILAGATCFLWLMRLQRASPTTV